MFFLSRSYDEGQILEVVQNWIEVLAKEDYELAFSELGYALAFGKPGAECIKNEIERYRSPDYFPGVERFTVTDWRSAAGGNPKPKRTVIWYQPNSTNLAGAISFDLPLNGKWSDLTADFVFTETGDSDGYVLSLEEIGSYAQGQRAIDSNVDLSDSTEGEIWRGPGMFKSSE